MSKVTLLISVDDKYKQQILEVVKPLQASGMKIEQIMEQIGVITGSIDSTQVEGVAAVEVSQQYQLDPPESEIQ